MRTLLAIWLLWLIAALPCRADSLLNPWTELLSEHVQWTADGSASVVDYDGLAQQRPALQAYLAELSAVGEAEYRGWAPTRRMAFLINAYNAFTVELILNADPRPESIRDLGSWFSTPWKQGFFELLGATRSLDEVEHELLRGDPEHSDPRIHFAVNCASIGCPALRPEAYSAEKLDAQLADQTRRFLSDRSRNRLQGNSLYISPIFKWYAEDFEQGWRGSASVAEFLILHGDALDLSPAQLQALRSGQLRMRYSEYDWGLNGT